jgi:hypothetical protein
MRDNTQNLIYQNEDVQQMDDRWVSWDAAFSNSQTFRLDTFMMADTINDLSSPRDRRKPRSIEEIIAEADAAGMSWIDYIASLNLKSEDDSMNRLAVQNSSNNLFKATVREIKTATPGNIWKSMSFGQQSIYVYRVLKTINPKISIKALKAIRGALKDDFQDFRDLVAESNYEGMTSASDTMNGDVATWNLPITSHRSLKNLLPMTVTHISEFTAGFVL